MIGLPSLPIVSLADFDAASRMRVWLCSSPIDMRLGFDRLAALAAAVTAQDPLSGHLFAFHSRRGDRMKILLFERDGYVLWYKRLEEGTFRLPKIDGQASIELRASELAMLLDGIDLKSVRRGKRYRRPNP